MPERSTKFSAIVAFFKMLAEKHVSIRHSATEKHFFRLEMDEVMTSLPETACFPMLVLESYNYNLNDFKSDNPIKKREGAFMLIDKVYDQGDFDEIHRKWDELEEIGDDIVARIKAEKRVALSPVRDFDITSVGATLISFGINSTVAIRFSYMVDSHFKDDVNPDKWI
jgi:hypothetical protein